MLCLSITACSSFNLSTLKLGTADAAGARPAVNKTANVRQAPESAGVVSFSNNDAGVVSTKRDLSTKLDLPTNHAPPAYAQLTSAITTRPVLNPVSFQPSQPRRAVVRVGNVVEPVSEIIAPSESVHEYPDEYLFDGGDRGTPVHYEGNQRSGLNTEDTIGEYVDHTGERHTRMSNRVAIYAPRFSAVRTVSGTEEGNHVNRASGAHRTQGGSNIANRTGLHIHTDSDSPGGLRVRSRPSGLNGDNRDTHISRVFRRRVHVKLLNAFEDRQFAQRAVFERTNSAWLSAGLDAAKAWAGDRSASISGSTSGAVEVKAEIKPQETVGIDDGKRTKGTLRIMKIADREVAVPGDEITFTIRYDNLGDHDLYEVVIVDNLTPRLQFVDDSDTSTHPGELVIESNGHGSDILRFIIDGALEGHSGGVLQFKTTVQ